MFKLLKNLKWREWICLLIGSFFIIIQVGLDLKIPDYMNNITLIIESNGTLGTHYTIRDIWSNGGYMLLCAFGSMLCSVITSFFVIYIASDFSWYCKTLQYR